MGSPYPSTFWWLSTFRTKIFQALIPANFSAIGAYLFNLRKFLYNFSSYQLVRMESNFFHVILAGCTGVPWAVWNWVFSAADLVGRCQLHQFSRAPQWMWKSWVGETQLSPLGGCRGDLWRCESVRVWWCESVRVWWCESVRVWWCESVRVWWCGSVRVERVQVWVKNVP